MNTDWYIFKGRNPEQPEKDYIPQPLAENQLPAPPRWRDFSQAHETDPSQRITRKERRGKTFYPSDAELEMVNAALYLRRPLLVTGKPGTGKTSLAYAVAYELDLGEVLYWPITTRTTLKDGLYSYDAIGRLQDFQLYKEDGSLSKDDLIKRIGKYIRLGALGTAFVESNTPRVLLIDEIDKSDIDLPNDLLHIFEEGEFSIPELERIAEEQPEVDVQTAYRDQAEANYQATVTVQKGRVRCQQFPFVILTSNAEREFPPAFLRRCLRLDIDQPSPERLRHIVSTQLDEQLAEAAKELIQTFYEKREQGGGDRATDQLLNAVFLITQHKAPPGLMNKLFRPLDK